MLPQPGFFYLTKDGEQRAKVVSRNSTDISYIIKGEMRYCTIGEFHQLFDLLTKHKPVDALINNEPEDQ